MSDDPVKVSKMWQATCDRCGWHTAPSTPKTAVVEWARLHREECEQAVADESWNKVVELAAERRAVRDARARAEDGEPVLHEEVADADLCSYWYDAQRCPNRADPGGRCLAHQAVPYGPYRLPPNPVPARCTYWHPASQGVGPFRCAGLAVPGKEACFDHKCAFVSCPRPKAPPGMWVCAEHGKMFGAPEPEPVAEAQPVEAELPVDQCFVLGYPAWKDPVRCLNPAADGSLVCAEHADRTRPDPHCRTRVMTSTTSDYCPNSPTIGANTCPLHGPSLSFEDQLVAIGMMEDVDESPLRCEAQVSDAGDRCPNQVIQGSPRCAEHQETTPGPEWDGETETMEDDDEPSGERCFFPVPDDTGTHQCREAASSGYTYCSAHLCIMPGCPRPRRRWPNEQGGQLDRLCEFHLAAEARSNRDRLVPGRCEFWHTGMAQGSQCDRVLPAGFLHSCADHRCRHPGCPNARVGGASLCAVHQRIHDDYRITHPKEVGISAEPEPEPTFSQHPRLCTTPGCEQPATPNRLYCATHAWGMRS